jgi:hypothetical protein
VLIWYIFPVLVSRTKKNLATLKEIGLGMPNCPRFEVLSKTRLLSWSSKSKPCWRLVSASEYGKKQHYLGTTKIRRTRKLIDP